MPKKTDAVILLVVLVVAGLLLAVSRFMPKVRIEDRTAQETLAPDAVEYLEETSDPVISESVQATAEPQTVGPMPVPQTEEIRGYVVITVGGRQYGDPIPMDRDKVITIRQDDGMENKIHITPEKVYMESSTCANQDCVGQGEITLDNYSTRVLSTYIICLPNEVTIELVPVE